MMAPLPIARAFDMAEGADLDAVLDRHAGPKARVDGPISHIAAEPGVGRQEGLMGGRVSVAPPSMARRRSWSCSGRSAFGEVDAGVDAQHLLGRPPWTTQQAQPRPRRALSATVSVR